MSNMIKAPTNWNELAVNTKLKLCTFIPSCDDMKTRRWKKHNSTC
uniref:Uncharacterized protein n=1 Tax=Anguilla anguilla TaxID=7936 RepID=A0A0E9UN74_ANGAN